MRGLAFILKCWVLLGPWELGGRLAEQTGFFYRADYRAALAAAVELAQSGDVVVVGREVDSPWGLYSHAMLVVESPAGKVRLHAYETSVQVASIKDAPMCGEVALVHFDVTPEQRDLMVRAA